MTHITYHMITNQTTYDKILGIILQNNTHHHIVVEERITQHIRKIGQNM